VIAYGAGGATETVTPPDLGPATGLWFEEQTTESLVEAIRRFEALADTFDPAAARRQALRFNRQRFADELIGYLEGLAPRPARRAA
jgi:hypothetical protein